MTANQAGRFELAAPGKSVQLFLDDVDAILAILRGVAREPGSRVWVDYKGDDLGVTDAARISARLKNNGIVTDISLGCTTPAGTIDVRLMRPVQVIHFPASDEELSAAAWSILTLLRERQIITGGVSLGATTVRGARWLQLLGLLFFVFVISTILGLSLRADEAQRGLPMVVGLAAVSTLLVAFIVKILLPRNPNPLAAIVLRTRNDRTGRAVDLSQRSVDLAFGVVLALVIAYLMRVLFGEG